MHSLGAGEGRLCGCFGLKEEIEKGTPPPQPHGPWAGCFALYTQQHCPPAVIELEL